jgi:hypothetical protein
LSGDTDDTELIDLGKRLLGFLDEQRKISGVMTQSIQRTTPKGIVRAAFYGTIPVVEISTVEPGEETLELVYLFITSPDGLRIYDLGSKTLVTTVAGLAAYEVDAVDKIGKVVWMTGSNIIVRVDLSDTSAFGYNYPVNGITIDDEVTPGFAGVVAAYLSPDQTRLLVAFDTTYDMDGPIDGLGGYVLADAETLAPVRAALRMTFRPQCACWGPDGKFYLATTLNADPGDAPSVGVADSPLDYVSQFTADGVLLGSRSLYDFGFSPGTAFGRTIRALAASAERVYVWHREGATAPYSLTVLDATDPALPILSTMEAPAYDCRNLLLARDGVTLAALHDGRVSEFNVAGAPFLLHTVVTSNAGGDPVAGPLNGSATALLQVGVESRLGAPADWRRYLLNNAGSTGVVYAYGSFADDPIFEYDLDALDVGDRYRLANVGALRKGKTA